MATETRRIEIVPAAGRVTVELDGELLAQSDRALALHEAAHRVRHYIPREDVRAELLATDKHTHCPFKGDASYYHVVAGGKRHDDLVWFYPDPIAGVEPIRNLVSFYDERVDLRVGGE